MKKLLAFLFLIPCVAHAGTITTSFNPLGSITFSSGTAPSPQFSLLASTIAQTSDGNSVTTTGINTTGASFLVIGFTFYTGGSAPNPPIITDSKSNTWTALSVSSVTASLGSIIYYSTNPIVGSGHTFSESAGNSFGTICVLAFSGGLSPNLFDQQNGNSANGSGATILTGPVVPSADNEMIMSVMAAENAGAISINSGFTISNQIQKGSSSYNTGCAYLINGSGTSGVSINPSWVSAGSNAEAARIATFK